MAFLSENRVAAHVGRFGKAFVLVAGLTLVAACDTAEERAEKHYQAGLALLEEGDYDRALVEFRNVFKLDGQHKEARLSYARVQRQRGFAQEAYSQYLRLVEQYPNDLEGRRALAEMALVARNWDEVERHATKAAELAPNDPSVQSIENTMKYFQAVRDKDEPKREAAVIKAQALIESDDTLTSSREIVIDDLLRKGDWYAALDAIDDGLAQNEDDKALYQLRLGVLQQVGDADGIVTQLLDLIKRYPDERANYKQALIQYYVAQNRIDEAEAFLRDQLKVEDSTTDDRGFLVGFIERFRGPDAAMATIEELIAANDSDIAFLRSARAKLNFDKGNREAAIAEMQALTEGAERTDQTRQIEVNLARMLFAENNVVGARALVEKVLAEDRSQPAAVKLKANWLIDDDETGDAIVMLRDALSLTPQDPDLMTLMAKAHEREGNRDLMQEMLSLAVQASKNAPQESLRYASVLIGDDKLRAAEGVIVDALRARPQDLQLLFQLGDIYVRSRDWGRADGVIEALNGLGADGAKEMATELTARKLAGQERGAELTTLLESLADDPEAKGNVRIALLRTRIANEGPEAGLKYLQDLKADNPDDPSLRFVEAGLKAGLGQEEEAEQIFRGLLAEDQRRAAVWMALYRLKIQQRDLAAASQVIDDALKVLPEDGNVMWAKAGELERAGDPEGAIAIYEVLYERSSASMIIANNLASLLSARRDDAESLQRAYTVARRLRDSTVPAFQDTYGWIAFRRGNQEESLPYLEAAAAGLPNEPSVSYHLAVNLAALGRNDVALEKFRKVAEMIKDATPVPEFADTVASEIERLSGSGKN